MDLSFFDVKSAADRGAPLHLKNPFTFEPLFIDEEKEQPFIIKVLGRDSKVLSELVKKTQAAVAEGEMTSEEEGELLTAAAIVGWPEGVELEGEELPWSPENAQKLVKNEKTSWVIEQVIPFYMSRRNYAPSANAG